MDGGSKPPLDVVFGILKNKRRRQVLEYLQDTEEVPLGQLAEHIAATENDTTPKQLASSQRKRVYVGLYQCHLPKMDDAGVIDYDQQRGRIRRTDRIEHVQAYLEDTTDTEPRRLHPYYGAISAIGIVVTVAGAGLTLPPAILTSLTLAVFVTGLACAWYQGRVTERGE